MKTLRRYTITLLVAAAAFLPVLWRVFPDMLILAQVGLGLLVAALVGYVEHQKNAKPLLELEAKRTYLFDHVLRPGLEALRAHDPTARLNVMEIDRRVFDRFSAFRMVYGPSLEGDPDAGLSLGLRQGVCGQAVADAAFTAADLEVPDGPTFGLSPEQLQKTADLTLVMSMPIKKARRQPDGTSALEDEIIGVVNIDSKRAGAMHLYASTAREAGGEGTLLDAQKRALADASVFCSYLMS